MKSAPFTALAAAAALASPLPGFGQTAYAERSEPVVLGQEIHLFSLPTKNAAGTSTKYWDVTVTLQLDPGTGKPLSSAGVNAVPSPKVKVSQFVLGTYLSDDGETCTLGASAFAGRTQYELRCTSSGWQFVSNWYSGRIPGHPYETELVAAGLDQIIGTEEYAWGKVLFDNATTWFSCFNDPELHSARQVGDILTLINYGSNNVVDCQMSFTRTGP